jgi:hypothetical protein
MLATYRRPVLARGIGERPERGWHGGRPRRAQPRQRQPAAQSYWCYCAGPADDPDSDDFQRHARRHAIFFVSLSSLLV